MHLSQIVFAKTNVYEALEMFKNGELDWLGRPLRPWHSFFDTEKTEKTNVFALLSRVFWCSLNVNSFPFNNLKIRQALSLALNRRELVEALQDGQPAFSPLPPHCTSFGSQGKEEGEKERAQQLFEEALTEIGLTHKNFPVLHLIHPDGEKREQIARIISKQWKQVLDIDIDCQGYPWSTLFRKVTEGDYEMACIGWTPLVRDPLYTFDAFRWPHDAMNFPKWENREFQELLKKSLTSNGQQERLASLKEAEAILIRESPVIPLIYEREQAIKKENVKTKLKNNFFDFRNIYIEN